MSTGSSRSLNARRSRWAPCCGGSSKNGLRPGLSRAQEAQVSEHMRTSDEGIALTAFANATLDDVLNFEEAAAATTRPSA